MELVEIRHDYVKIPEQNLATFFFYKAFVKDNLVSFETLLQKYFETNKNRFKDCVIPANNTFGKENVMQTLKTVFKLINEKDIYLGIGKHFCNSFFWNLPQEQKERANKFLLDYCRENYENSQKINVE